jgi:hypothetical protein
MEGIGIFLRGDGGTVTVDWVMLTALSVTMTLALMGVLSDALETAGTNLSDALSDMPIRTSFAEWEAFRASQTPPVAPDPAPEG